MSNFQLKPELSNQLNNRVSIGKDTLKLQEYIDKYSDRELVMLITLGIYKSREQTTYYIK